MNNYKSEWFKPNQLQEQLDALRDKKFGNLTGFELMHNARPPKIAKELVVTESEFKSLIKR